MAKKRPVRDFVKPTRMQVAAQVRNKRAMVAMELKAIEAQFFAAEPALLGGGVFSIGSRSVQEGGRHYK